MIENVKKHKEKSKLSDKFEQPFNKTDTTITVLGRLANMQKRKKKKK
jgi:hypothetical protein